MNERQIFRHISELVDEEHRLYERAAAEGDGLDRIERDRLHALGVELDQCWDLLRQRRARREFGQNPDEARVRDPDTVERYQQ